MKMIARPSWTMLAKKASIAVGITHHAISFNDYSYDNWSIKKAVAANECTSSVVHFDGHAEQVVQCWVHCPVWQVLVLGYPRCWRTLPLGEYLPCIAPADAMVIDFGSKYQGVALWNCCFKASVQKAQNRPSTQLIKVTNCVKSSNATIEAEELSNFSSYRMLTANRNWQSC